MQNGVGPKLTLVSFQDLISTLDDGALLCNSLCLLICYDSIDILPSQGCFLVPRKCFDIVTN